MDTFTLVFWELHVMPLYFFLSRLFNLIFTGCFQSIIQPAQPTLVYNHFTFNH